MGIKGVVCKKATLKVIYCMIPLLQRLGMVSGGSVREKVTGEDFCSIGVVLLTTAAVAIGICIYKMLQNYPYSLYQCEILDFGTELKLY